MHHLSVSISVPSVACTYFRAFIAGRARARATPLSSQLARWLVAIVINDDNYYKEVNFPIVDVITLLWALSQPSLSRIIERSRLLPFARLFRDRNGVLAEMFHSHTLQESRKI